MVTEINKRRKEYERYVKEALLLAEEDRQRFSIVDNNIFKKCVSGCDECLYPFDESNHHCTQCNSEYEEYYFPLIDQYIIAIQSD